MNVAAYSVCVQVSPLRVYVPGLLPVVYAAHRLSLLGNDTATLVSHAFVMSLPASKITLVRL
jgi:hypothetical protein